MPWPRAAIGVRSIDIRKQIKSTSESHAYTKLVMFLTEYVVTHANAHELLDNQ